MKYPNYVKSITRSGEQPPSPVGWDQRIYRSQPGPFEFTKNSLYLSNSCFIEQIYLSEGAIRVDGIITADRLQIGIFESENYRLLGFNGCTTIGTLSYSGSLWDAVAAAPSKGVTFNAGPELTRKIITKDISDKLIADMTNKGVFSSLFLSLNKNVSQLANTIEQVFHLVKLLDTNQIDELQFKWIEEDIIGCAISIVDELVETKYSQPSIKHNTYELAHKIEDILWDDPKNIDSNVDLEYLSKYFSCSRRQIQLAIEEHFGTNFVAFKRLIRLLQFKEQLDKRSTTSEDCIVISELASEYNFDHLGRFSGYYKNMFGETPRTSHMKIRRKK